MITRLLSLDAIMKNPAMLAKQPAHELRETRIVAHAVAAALDAAEADDAPASGNPEGSSLMTAEEAAAYLNCKESLIRESGRRGKLATVKLGEHAVRYERAALDAFAHRK